MLDDQPDTQSDDTTAEGSTGPSGDSTGETTAPVVKKTTRKRTTRKVTTPPPSEAVVVTEPSGAPAEPAAEPAAEAPPAPVVKKTVRTRTSRTTAASTAATTGTTVAETEPVSAEGAAKKATAAKKASTTKAAATKTAAAKKTTATKTAAAKKTTAKKASTTKAAATKTAATKTAATKKTTAKKTSSTKTAAAETSASATESTAEQTAEPTGEDTAAGTTPLFKAPEKTSTRRTPRKAPVATDEQPDEKADEAADEGVEAGTVTEDTAADAADVTSQEDEQSSDTGSETQGEESDDSNGAPRRRRRRGGRRRRKPGNGGGDQQGGQQGTKAGEDADEDAGQDTSGQGGGSAADAGSAKGGGDDSGDGEGSSSSRRRRRRRRAGDDGNGNGGGEDDPSNTVTRVRQGRSAEDQITSLSGSTRLEAKKQRRREGREAGRRRAPIVSEAEFLARREAVDRSMVIRQHDDLTQIAVLEDKVLVEHYVARESQTSLIGNVYLGRVQNVLPSMEAAFIDIGKGRNAVLYAGEVNWSSLGHKEGQPRKIESVLQSGQMVLVQVTKDPVGHKGARLTSQISLAGRFLVYVPDGTTSGISRKLPDTERSRLKKLLKEIVPDSAGVIVRTAAEGASEDELTSDVERLKARWEDIEVKAGNKGSGAQLLYGEPDLTLKVVRDLFTEDFSELVIQGDDAWKTVQGYVTDVAPDLEERLAKFEPATEGKDSGKDIFAVRRIDEQIKKGLDRKVWLPSGGSLIIDRTEAMTVVDVNTGKFTGSGGNLEETVTKNNLEAAEEIVRQLRLRDIGGIIVVDFIDMVLESNRDLVVRRLVECLGRDRTRHQVAEVTSLGLVQMTRKRIGTGLVESFSHNCEHCQGRGVVIEDAPVEPKQPQDDSRRGGSSGGRRRGRGKGGSEESGAGSPGGRGSDSKSSGSGGGPAPSPKDVAAMARAPKHDADEAPADQPAKQPAPEPSAEPAPGAAAEPAGADSAQVVPDAAVETPEKPAQEAQEAPVEPVAPAEPEAPKVVTRTRRRSASRPAGPPVAADVPTTPAPSEPAVSGAGTVPTHGGVEPGTVEVEPGAEATASTESADSAEATASADSAESAESAEAEEVVHVPIKRKGSHKR